MAPVKKLGRLVRVSKHPITLADHRRECLSSAALRQRRGLDGNTYPG
jgi:hypothetical protein